MINESSARNIGSQMVMLTLFNEAPDPFGASVSAHLMMREQAQEMIKVLQNACERAIWNVDPLSEDQPKLSLDSYKNILN